MGRKPGPKNLKADDYIRAIKAGNGVITLAAKKLGVSRQAVHNAVNKYVTVKDALDEAQAVTVDEAEGRLIKAMKTDQKWAIKMILRTQGGERWQETQRVEHAGEGGGPVRVMYDRNTPEPDE